MALYDTDLDQLQGEILVWLQDHQADYRQIALVHKTLQSYAEAMGGTAVLSTFESVYANAYMSGGLPALWDHPGAEQLANDILAPIAGASMMDTMLGYRAMGPGIAPCSFAADTLVATNDGQKAISDINIGVFVLAFNETTGETDFYTVTALISHVDPVLVTLVINGEQIVTTPEHPFYTTENGWTPAGALQIGDEIRRANGSISTVQTITVTERSQVMYNLTVADAHTFFVGSGQWLVHNQCPPYDRAAFGDWKPGVRRDVVARDRGRCVYCGENDDLTVDHITPVKQVWEEGAYSWTPQQRNEWFNDPNNLVTACRSCNSSKNSDTLLGFIRRFFGGD